MLNILTVDDNRDGANMTSALLKHHGSNVMAVYDGESAIAALSNVHFDVVLLDIVMPRMCGIETCRKIRQMSDGNSLTIIALTGLNTTSDRVKIREAGFDFHMPKPLDAKLLSDMLKIVAGI